MSGDRIAAEAFFLAMLRSTLPAVESLEPLAFFQRSAVARLEMMIERFGGAILADEIGLGKSFVGAALARRYQDRGFAVEIIAPASIHEQWQETLQSFGVRAEIEHSEALHRRPWVKADEAKLIVVDEAHRFRNPGTSGYRAFALRSIGQRLLLITASPFWNRTNDIRALLALFLADDAVRFRGVLSLERSFDSLEHDAIERILEEVMVRRGRAVLGRQFVIGSLQNRVVRHPVPGIDAARPLIEKLQFPLIAHAQGDRRLLRRFLFRRLESSLEAFRDTLSRQRKFYRRAEESMRDGRRLTKPDYRILYGDETEETPFQELLFRDLWISQPAVDQEAAMVSGELEVIDELLSIERGREDRKLFALINLLERLDGPSLVFTGAIATASGIHRECAKAFPAALITSRAVTDARGLKALPSGIFAAFHRGEIDVIVSTDRSSEGLNLQTASNVIHYDIPWSPLRLDQRNGRAHRIGRVNRVTAWYFIPAGLADSKVMKIVARKNRQRRDVLGRDGKSDRHQRWSWIERSLLAFPLAVEGMSLEIADGESAILLVERIKGRETSRELVLSCNGSVDDSWAAIVKAVPHGTSTSEPMLLDGQFDKVSDRIERRIRTFAFLPAVLQKTSAGRRLCESARRNRLLDGELETLLARRYPAGIEMIMQQMAGEYLDAARIADLLALLRGRPFADVPDKVRVIAALKVGGT